ncbi:zingipain-2-like [Spodoptera litura]|uniref:Zingipain-2-like n=1 Tax=Spodoptera litura TaxID=69820 RepID=A0A9J7E2H0_SPOLT|nr:zingipain-2-like [Spodoptera litura]
MLALFLICIFFGVDFSSTAITSYSLDNVDQHFNDFVVKYNKMYADEEERLNRSQIFAENLKKIIELNARRESHLYDVTHFMDLTQEEFTMRYTGLSEIFLTNDCPYLFDEDIEDVDAPESFDWRDHNAVTPVKHQYECSSCYAFSAIANIESQVAIKYNTQVDLSEQQIVDCNSRTLGCTEGLMAPTFRYLMKAGGAVREPDYPYFGYQSQCYFNRSWPLFNIYPRSPPVQVTSCNSLRLTSQEKVKQLLYKYGPISIAIRADKFRYIGRVGIITDQFCTGPLNHAVLLVGYGTENGMPYWIVKNSWGSGWHDQGYFKMQRGEHAESCGMMNAAMAIAFIA